jgi:hypothetical protein
MNEHLRNTLAVIAVGALAAVSPYMPAAFGQGGGEADPIFGIKVPAGYRDWRLISVAREEAPLDDVRAILGNDIAINAYRNGQRPFPDGTIISRLAWSYVPSEENNTCFACHQSASARDFVFTEYAP